MIGNHGPAIIARVDLEFLNFDERLDVIENDLAEKQAEYDTEKANVSGFGQAEFDIYKTAAMWSNNVELNIRPALTQAAQESLDAAIAAIPNFDINILNKYKKLALKKASLDSVAGCFVSTADMNKTLTIKNAYEWAGQDEWKQKQTDNYNALISRTTAIIG